MSPTERCQTSATALHIVVTGTLSTAPEPTNRERINLDAVPTQSHFTVAEVDKLRLMNHYAQSTSKSIANLTFVTPEGLSLWRDYVPQLAFEHDFLLHGLLGISSLHLALSQPSVRHKYSVLAIHHYNLGITRFRPHLTNVTADNINALFAFSCIIALYSFGIHCIVDHHMTPLARIHEVLMLIRGTGVIVQSGINWLMEGPWEAMMMQYWADPMQKLPDEIENVLAELSRRVNTTVAATAQSGTYLEAISALRLGFLLATAHPQLTKMIVKFPLLLQPEFMELLCIGEPLALAILGNYAVTLHWIREHIWMGSWGKQVVDAVRDALPLEWHECIAWAIKETESGSDAVSPIARPWDADKLLLP